MHAQEPWTDHDFSTASRLTLLNHDLSGTVNDANWAYTYTDAGQVETRNVVQAYEWPVEALDEDYQRNGLNQYTSVEGVTFTHDRRGNLTSDGQRSFCYDLENRLIGVAAAPTDACVNPSTLQLAYDPLGRLRQTTAGATVTQFVYDGDRLVAEYDGSAAVLRRYVHGPGVDEPIVWYEGPTLANRRWLLTDRQGSVIAATDSGAALVGTPYRYGPYGEPEDDNWTGSRFRYTGQAALPEARLYHYKARVYDPGLGRFLQTDPVGYEDDFNLYAYVRNDPLNNSDPTGKCTAPGVLQACAAGGGALLGGAINLGAQLLSNEGSLSERLSSVDWGDVGEAALAGGATGLALTAPGLQAHAGLVGGGISATVSAGRDLVTTGEVDAGDVAGAFVGGAIGARGGSEASRVLWGQTNQRVGQAVAAAGGEAAGRTVAERGGPVVREALRPVANAVVRAVDQELDERERQIPQRR